MTKVLWFLILSTMLSYPLLPKFFLSKLCKGRDWGNCLRLANKQSSGLMSSMQEIQIACKSYHWHQKLESVSQPTCPQVAVSLTLSHQCSGERSCPNGFLMLSSDCDWYHRTLFLLSYVNQNVIALIKHHAGNSKHNTQPLSFEEDTVCRRKIYEYAIFFFNTTGRRAELDV